MPRWAQSSHLLQNTGSDFLDLCDHLCAECCKILSFFNDKQPTAFSNRFDDGPRMERVKLYRTHHFTDNLMFIKECIGRSFCLGKHPTIAKHSEVWLSLRAKSQCGVPLIAVLPNKPLDSRVRHTNAIEELIFNDNDGAIDRRKQGVENERRIVPMIDGEHQCASHS